MAKEVIPAQTAAAIGDVEISNPQDLPATLVIHNLSAAENVPIQISHDGGGTFADLYDNAAIVQFTYQSKTIIKLDTPGYYRVNKGITALTVSVGLSTLRSP